MMKDRGYLVNDSSLSLTFSSFIHQYEETLTRLYDDDNLYLPFSFVVYTNQQQQEWTLPQTTSSTSMMNMTCLNAYMSFLTNFTVDLHEPYGSTEKINIRPCPPEAIIVLFVAKTSPLCTEFIKHLIFFQRLVNNYHMIVIMHNLENKFQFVTSSRQNAQTLQSLRQPNNKRHQNRRIEFFSFAQRNYNITNSLFHSEMTKLSSPSPPLTIPTKKERMSTWIENLMSKDTRELMESLVPLYKIKKLGKTASANRFKERKKYLKGLLKEREHTNKRKQDDNESSSEDDEDDDDTSSEINSSEDEDEEEDDEVPLKLNKELESDEYHSDQDEHDDILDEEDDDEEDEGKVDDEEKKEKEVVDDDVEKDDETIDIEDDIDDDDVSDFVDNDDYD